MGNKRSLDPTLHSQDMSESGGRLERSIRTTGLTPRTAGIVLRDVEDTAAWLTTVGPLLTAIAPAWHGNRDIRRDNLDNLTNHLQALTTAAQEVSKAAAAAALSLRPELETRPVNEALPATPNEPKPATSTANGTSKTTT